MNSERDIKKRGIMNNNCKEKAYKFLNNDYESEQDEKDLLSHFLSCEKCERFLTEEGYDREHIDMLISISDDAESDPSVIESAMRAKDRVYRRVIESAKKREIQTETGRDWLERIKESLFPAATFLRPAFITVILIVIAAGYILKTNFLSTEESYTGIKGRENFVNVIELDFGSADIKEERLSDIKRGIEGGTYTKNNYLFFRYILSIDAYLYIIHSSNNKTDIIYPLQGDELITKGESELKAGRDELFLFGFNDQQEGRHIFIAAASKKPVERDILIRRIRSLDDITDTEDIKRAFNDIEGIDFDMFKVILK